MGRTDDQNSSQRARQYQHVAYCAIETKHAAQIVQAHDQATQGDRVLPTRDPSLMAGDLGKTKVNAAKRRQ